MPHRSCRMALKPQGDLWPAINGHTLFVTSEPQDEAMHSCDGPSNAEPGITVAGNDTVIRAPPFTLGACRHRLQRIANYHEARTAVGQCEFQPHVRAGRYLTDCMD